MESRKRTDINDQLIFHEKANIIQKRKGKTSQQMVLE